MLEGSFLDFLQVFWKAMEALECLSNYKCQIFGLIFVHLIYFCFLIRSNVVQSPVGAVEVAASPNSPYQFSCLCWIVVLTSASNYIRKNTLRYSRSGEQFHTHIC